MVLPKSQFPPTLREKSNLEVANDYLRRYYYKPNRWLKEVLGVDPWSMQREIVDLVFNHPKVAVRSCHSAGKTFIAACIVLAFLYIRTPCKIITSAPTGFQVRDLLWSEINHLYNTRLKGKKFPPGFCLTTRLKVREDWYALGISPRDSVNFQGYHQKNVLVVLDEAPGVRADVVAGAETLESSGDVHVLKIGNPDDAHGHFFEAFRDPRYKKVKISAFDTPNFTGESVDPEVAAGLTSKAWVEDRKNKWGVHHPMYQSKVLAEFPDASSDRVIPLSVCERAKERWYDLPDDDGDDVVGVDVAWYGGDISVITRRSGLKIVEMKTCVQRDPVEVAGVVKMMYNKKPFRVANVDRIGIGAGTLATLQHWGLPAVGVDAAERAYDFENYHNRRAELWFGGGEWLQEGGIPDDEDLVQELTEPNYILRNGRYLVEPKEELRKAKRLGRSPDKADSVHLAITKERERETRVAVDTVSTDEALRQMGHSLGEDRNTKDLVRVGRDDIISGVAGGRRDG